MDAVVLLKAVALFVLETYCVPVKVLLPVVAKTEDAVLLNNVAFAAFVEATA
jgi:hypothetical protein